MDEKDQYSKQLKFVLLVVLILCGGNGVGIIAAALVWKFTSSLAGTILTVVAITAVAFLCAMAMILRHNRKQKRS